MEEAEKKSSLPEIRTFARGVHQDEAAVRAAISMPWSNSQGEGHVGMLKLIKRQIFGHAKLVLLRRWVLRAA